MVDKNDLKTDESNNQNKSNKLSKIKSGLSELTKLIVGIIVISFPIVVLWILLFIRIFVGSWILAKITEYIIQPNIDFRIIWFVWAIVLYIASDMPTWRKEDDERKAI